MSFFIIEVKNIQILLNFAQIQKTGYFLLSMAYDQLWQQSRPDNDMVYCE